MHSHIKQVEENTPNDADIHARDDSKYTPILLVAEACGKAREVDCRAVDSQAFQYLMECINDEVNVPGVKDVQRNPLFQALEVVGKFEAEKAVKV